jgi:hypothetical protein
LIFIDIFEIKSQIKSPNFNMILKISKSSQNDLKSDFVKSSIKSLNTLVIGEYQIALCILRLDISVHKPRHKPLPNMQMHAIMSLDKQLAGGKIMDEIRGRPHVSDSVYDSLYDYMSSLLISGIYIGFDLGRSEWLSSYRRCLPRR